MGLVEKMIKIDSRWLWLVLLLAFVIPVLNPIGLPIRISNETHVLYDHIRALPEGSVVAFDVTYPYAYLTEMEPAVTAVTAHLFTLPVKVVFWSLTVEGPLVTMVTLEKVKAEIEKYGKKYGEDYVVLGYVPGEETAMAALMTDTQHVVSSDYFGNSIDTLPLMTKVRNSRDMRFLICVSVLQADEKVRQYFLKGGLTWAAIVTTGWIPGYRPFVEAKQILTALGGLRGGAEYETLTGRIARGAAYMDVMSSTHLTTVAAAIVANILFLYQRGRSKR